LSTPIRHWEWGLAFRDMKPDGRIVMQEWLLAALPDKEPNPLNHGSVRNRTDIVL
jgi:hypothetical protein